MEAPHPVINDGNICDTIGREETYLCPLIHPSRYGGVSLGETVALATGFANRSAVMFELKLYERCIFDIDLAMKYGFPEDKQTKLVLRRMKCLTEMNILSNSAKNYLLGAENETSEATAASSEPDSGFWQKLLSMLKASDKKTPIHKIFSYVVRDAPRMTEVNENVPALSSAVGVSFIPSKGKGLLATRDIEPGELLGVEEAHSVYIETTKLNQYCSSCLRLTYNPLPCPACPKALYCNETCRMRGLTEEHWLECSLLPTLNSLGLSDRNLMYKMLKTLTYSQLKDFISRLRTEEEENEGPINPEKGFQNSQSYESLYHLCTSKDKQNCAFILVQCQIAFVITQLLLQSGRFFIKDKGEPLYSTTEDIVKTGAALLFHALQLHCIPFELNDLQMKAIVGAGVFPTLSLINHSCYPPASHHAYGRTLTIRAMRPISAGEEITVSYAFEYYKLSQEKRTAKLNRYKFSCTCEACVNNWPTFPELPSLIFKCLACKIPMARRLTLCGPCGIKNGNPESNNSLLSPELKEEVDSTLMRIVESSTLNEKIKNDMPLNAEDYELIIETLQRVYRHVVVPCQQVVIMQNFLFRCFEDGF